MEPRTSSGQTLARNADVKDDFFHCSRRASSLCEAVSRDQTHQRRWSLRGVGEGSQNPSEFLGKTTRCGAEGSQLACGVLIDRCKGSALVGQGRGMRALPLETAGRRDATGNGRVNWSRVEGQRDMASVKRLQ